MADNTTLNPGSGGDEIATDDIGGVKHQLIKLEYGADGSATQVNALYPLPTSMVVGDGANVDAFSRLRVSAPSAVFDAQLTYDLQPLLFEQTVVASGASIAHDSTNRMALMTFASTPTGGEAYMQSFEHFRYQPGRSHMIFVTFNMLGGVANVLKFAGYSDGVNGVEFQMSGTVPQMVL